MTFNKWLLIDYKYYTVFDSAEMTIDIEYRYMNIDIDNADLEATISIKSSDKSFIFEKVKKVCKSI